MRVTLDSTFGAAVLTEVKVAGNLYLVPAGKTFTGICVLFVGDISGLVTVQDASDNIYASANWALGVPVNPVITPISGVVGGGGGSQLSVVVAAGALLISATVAGYIQ